MTPIPTRVARLTAPVVALACGAIPACWASPALASAPTRVAAPAAAPSYVPVPVCRAPTRGRVGCLAYQLAPSSTSAAAATLSKRSRARVRTRERAILGASTATESTAQPEPVFPKDLHSAYQLPTEPPAGAPQQTIALVDAYNDLAAEADLREYDERFQLKACTEANGCFEQLNQRGETANLPFPRSKAALEARETKCRTTSPKETLAQRREREEACLEVEEALGWGVEIATDVEVAHSVCETCQIRLIEAESSEYSALETAEETAARPTSEGGAGASEISNSWGGEEPLVDRAAFNHPGIVVTASAGDDGYLNWTEAEAAGAEKRPYYSGADYPASSPHVVAVGGTELVLTAEGRRQSERVWNEDPNPEGHNSGAGGGGCSAVFAPPVWQREVPDWSRVGCESEGPPRRAVADVAADGDPYTGVLVYDSAESKENLLIIGGTSVASPIVAATFALAGGADGVEYPAQTLYAHRGTAGLYDVTGGGNGRCDALYTEGCSGSMSPLSSLAPLDCGEGVLICDAAAGYDGPTGLGTPNGIAAFEAGSGEGEQQTEGSKEEGGGGEKTGSEGSKESGGEPKEGGGGSKGSGEQPAGGSGAQGTGTNPTGGGSGAGQTQLGTGTAPGVGAQAGEQGSVLMSGLGGAASRAVRLTELTLTPHARAAIAGHRRAIAELAVTFRLSAAARIRVSLARRVLREGRWRWVAQPGGFTVAPRRGRNRVGLRGSLTLQTGRYRVTLAPIRGAARSVTFVLG